MKRSMFLVCACGLALAGCTSDGGSATSTTPSPPPTSSASTPSPTTPPSSTTPSSSASSSSGTGDNTKLRADLNHIIDGLHEYDAELINSDNYHSKTPEMSDSFIGTSVTVHGTFKGDAVDTFKTSDGKEAPKPFVPLTKKMMHDVAGLMTYSVGSQKHSEVSGTLPEGTPIPADLVQCRFPGNYVSAGGSLLFSAADKTFVNVDFVAASTEYDYNGNALSSDPSKPYTCRISWIFHTNNGTHLNVPPAN